RDHVKLNSRWGAADSGAKFDAEVALPREGQSFSLRLIYEGAGEKDHELILVGEAIRLLESSDLRLGAKSGWGYGRVKLTGASYAVYRRTDCAGLAAWFSSRLGSPQTPAEPFPFPKPLARASQISSRPFSSLALRFR